ncbi:hypothetical protein [Phormidium tenue]|uniref:Uncharacterized protein n=1 Tax=Phormidium tenue NIES-30 TaxID=549789 RepID=A0A1U7JAX9_9CYAN|nr:hypothetical protein [Phormidium tenue]MBD2230291.1 hypothetical protein [Phormidium tenue FACHB-1052]OKH50903.1 hypothetical protein NIES30_02130 [Phormidium tenue NIES-30]
MFLDELTPFVQELTAYPVAFLGGLASGLLRLSLSDDPVKSWLQNQGITPPNENGSGWGSSDRNGGPQSISID